MSAPVHEPSAPVETSSRNTLGIIALVTAAIGFIFACMPGALIVGWILLPISFILALVSLFMRGKKRGTGIAALIISVVGTVVGVIVFITVVGSAFDDAFNEETTATVPEGDHDDDSAAVEEDADEDVEAELAAEEGATEDADGEEGTRANPYPLGTEISTDDWTVTVNSVDLNADEAIAAENPYNEAPEEGHQYILVNVTVQYTGTDPEGGMPMESVAFVSAAGNTFNSYDKTAVEPDALDTLTTLYEGASETGNIAIHVPSEDIEAGTLSVSPDMFADSFFVAVN